MENIRGKAKPYALFRRYATDGGTYTLSASSQTHSLFERALKLEDSIVDAQSAVTGRLGIEAAGSTIHCCMFRSVKTVKAIMEAFGDTTPTMDQLLQHMCESDDSFLAASGTMVESRLPMFLALLRICELRLGQSVIVIKRDEVGGEVCLAPDGFLIAIAMTPFDSSDRTRLPVYRLAPS